MDWKEIDIDPNEARTALWNAGILSYKLWPQQIPIYDQIRSLPSNVDEAVVLCARQFGKSTMGVILALEDCLRYDDVCILVIGPTLKQTREIVAPRLRRIAADAPTGLIRPSKSEGKWYIGTSELVIGGMDINSSSQRGKTVQTCYIEEIVESKPDDYLEALRSDIGPALTHSKNGKIIYLTTLPKIPDHPFITETMARAELNGSLYIYTIDDNKALTPSQYEACVRRAGGRNTDDFKREYLCQIIRDRSIVIVPDFDKSVHVEDFTIPNPMNYEVYTDWGGVRDMTVSLLMGYDFLRGCDLVLDEMWWPHNTSTEQIVKDLRQKWGDYLSTHYVDAPGQIRVDLTDTHKMEVRYPNKDDWESNINHLAVRFAQRKVRIHPKCRLTIQTCQSGTFNKNRTDFERTHTLGHMDAIAAMMYGIRHLNRTSPYGDSAVRARDWQWEAPRAIEPMIVGKSFNQHGLRRFGN